MVHYKNWNQDTGLIGLRQDGPSTYGKTLNRLRLIRENTINPVLYKYFLVHH